MRGKTYEKRESLFKFRDLLLGKLISLDKALLATARHESAVEDERWDDVGCILGGAGTNHCGDDASGSESGLWSRASSKI